MNESPYSPPPLELGVGMDFDVTKALKMFYYIFGGLASGIGGFILALLIFIVTIIRRSVCKRRPKAPFAQACPPDGAQSLAKEEVM